MLHSSRFKASAFPFGISGLDRFSFLPAHLLTCVRLKLPVTRSPPTLGYGLVVSLCPTGFPPALCNVLAQPHEPSPLPCCLVPFPLPFFSNSRPYSLSSFMMVINKKDGRQKDNF